MRLSEEYSYAMESHMKELDRQLNMLRVAAFKAKDLLATLSMAVEGDVRREVCTAMNILAKPLGKARSSHGDAERE